MTGWAARRGRIGVPQPGGGAAEKNFEENFSSGRQID
jgi:hypothetical protein